MIKDLSKGIDLMEFIRLDLSYWLIFIFSCSIFDPEMHSFKLSLDIVRLESRIDLESRLESTFSGRLADLGSARLEFSRQGFTRLGFTGV